jgi:hypothetical protein
VQGVLYDKLHTRDSFLTPARSHVVAWLGQDDEVVVSSSHNNGDCGRGIANGLIISLQSDRPAPYRCNMVSSIPNTFAGGREINASKVPPGVAGHPVCLDTSIKIRLKLSNIADMILKHSPCHSPTLSTPDDLITRLPDTTYVSQPAQSMLPALHTLL